MHKYKLIFEMMLFNYFFQSRTKLSFASNLRNFFKE